MYTPISKPRDARFGKDKSRPDVYAVEVWDGGECRTLIRPRRFNDTPPDIQNLLIRSAGAASHRRFTDEGWEQ